MTVRVEGAAVWLPEWSKGLFAACSLVRVVKGLLELLDAEGEGGLGSRRARRAKASPALTLDVSLGLGFRV